MMASSIQSALSLLKPPRFSSVSAAVAALCHPAPSAPATSQTHPIGPAYPSLKPTNPQTSAYPDRGHIGPHSTQSDLLLL
jgi:hypothetical protein